MGSSVVGGFLVVACSTESGVSFGNPNTLNGKNLPRDDGSVQRPSCADAGIASGDGGNCGVSWSKDLFPKVQANGAWRCANGSCHAAGATPPVIDDSAPDKARQSLIAAKIGNLPYIKVGDPEPNNSAFWCNLLRTCDPAMPTGELAKRPTKDELCQLEAWLRCGSPNN